MADADEDMPHPRGGEAADMDLTEETQDFRFLDKLGSSHDTGPLLLPKRGEKDFEAHSTNLQVETLEASRQAMHNVLSWQRTHTSKNHLLGMYHPETNMAYVEKAKTQHFLTIGRAKGGKEWLLPEEALFMIERGSLDCRWPVEREQGEGMHVGAPMSLQGAYAAFVGFEEGVGGKLTLEMYTVYAGLKRNGYVVFRHGNWDDDRPPPQPLVPKPQEQDKTGSLSRFFADIWRCISQPTYTVPPQNLAFGPLIKPGLYRSYADIYRLLQIIPAHERSAPPKLILPASSSNPFRIHFDVWKTSGTARFRKSAPGPPDFRVCVVDARETSIPTGAELNDLLATVPDDPPRETDPMSKKLKHGSRNVVLAVVDNGIPSYIRVADVPFADCKVYERTGGGPRGKGGSGRGGRGGRGRGRGRGG